MKTAVILFLAMLFFLGLAAWMIKQHAGQIDRVTQALEVKR
jgi:hypothetical protein